MSPSPKSFMRKILGCESGFLLIAALTLLGSLLLIGVTAYTLSSTGIKIGSNFRNSQMALQVATAGAEYARELLRQNIKNSVSGSLSVELAAAAGPNGTIQGSAAGSDDVPIIANGSMNGFSYKVFLTNDPVDGETNTTDTNKRVTLTAVATGANNVKAQVKIVVSLFPGLVSPAMVYSKGDVGGNGGPSLVVNGNDQCGQASSLPPVYSTANASFQGNPTLTGASNQPVQNGSINLDIANTVQMLSTMATTTLIDDQQDMTFGSADNYQIIYSWPDDPAHVNNQGLTLNNVTGYGILVVKGDLNLGGGFHWNGIIVATGAVTLNGGGQSPNVAGQIISGTANNTDLTINGSIGLAYNSCYVKNAIALVPLKVMNWKQVT